MAKNLGAKSQRNNLEIFSSFEEENEATAKLAASRSPRDNVIKRNIES